MASAEASSSSSSGTRISNPNGHEEEIKDYKEDIRDYNAEICDYKAEITKNMETIGRIESQMAGGGGGSDDESKRLYERNQTLQHAVTAVDNKIAESLKRINLLSEQQGRPGEKLFDVLHPNISPHCLGAFCFPPLSFFPSRC